jgi:hypothetical protein
MSSSEGPGKANPQNYTDIEVCYFLAHICLVAGDYVTLWIPALKATML